MPPKSKFTVRCRICGKPFRTSLYRIKMGKGKYCSVACRGDARSGSLVDKILSLIGHVSPGKGCLIWKGNRDKNGYGMFSFKGDGLRAHRVMYELVNGPVPVGLSVLHKCDRPWCVNPAHLFPGTNDDNMADMVSKGRSARGERHHKAQLTEKQVLEIRRRYKPRRVTRTMLAAEFQVDPQVIKNIVTYRTWRHLP